MSSVKRKLEEESDAALGGGGDEQTVAVVEESDLKRLRVEQEEPQQPQKTENDDEDDDDDDVYHPYAYLPITEVPGLHPTLLAERNRFAGFDDHVHFDEPTHIYTVDGVRYRGSCTAFLGQWFGKFDADAVADKIVGSYKWKNCPNYRYYQMTREEIKDDWTMANKLGTRFHFCAELRMNGIEVPTHPDFQRREYAHHFNNFWRDHVEGKLRPWRSEWIVFHRVYEIIGSVDGILQRVDSDDPYELVLYDWKRCIKIDQEAFMNETATGPFAGLPKANFWKYALQLNTYKFIIEQGTPYRVSEMFLLRCHPDAPNYERLKVPDMQHYVRKAVAVRFERLMETDLTTLARTLKRLSSAPPPPPPTTTTTTDDGEAAAATEESTPEATPMDADAGKEQDQETASSSSSSSDSDEPNTALPESPLDPPALALQILSRYKAHARSIESVPQPLSSLPTLPCQASSAFASSTNNGLSAEQDVRRTYKFDDA